MDAGSGYTNGMKTAISLPDELYGEVEDLARKMRKSRSQLYRDALEEYVARHQPDEIRDSLDSLVDDLDGADAELTDAAARKVLETIEW